MGKGLFQSKTAWVNGLTALVSIAAYFQGSELLAANPQAVAIIGAVIGVANVFLRIITKEAIVKA